MGGVKELTLDELIAGYRADAPKHRKKPSDEEHRIQCACVQWFRYQYPALRKRLVAVPNGGKRDKVTAGKLSDEGVIPGVADLILFVSNRDYGALCLEMKTPTGTQSSDQKEWAKDICSDGEFKYVICRSLEQFIDVITEYLNNTKEST